MAINDPDAPKKKATPAKKAAPRTGDPEAVPKKPAKKAAPPPIVNNPTGNYGQDPNRPGLGLGIDRGGTGIGYSFSQYDSWLSNMMHDEGFQAMRAKYGNSYVAFEWRALTTNMDAITYQNALIMTFPDIADVKIGGGAGPGGGGGRGGGGGGGAPTPQQIAAAKAAIKNRVAIIGLPAMSEEELTTLATTVVTDDWSNEMLDDELLKDPNKVTQPGDMASTIQQIKQMAAAQLLTASDLTAKEWATKILSGEMNLDAVRTIFATQAAGEFGWAAQGIAAGQTVRDMLLPARDKIANELEMNADAIDLMDPKWRNMVTVTDDKTGAKRAATMTEISRAARSDTSSFIQTNAARSKASNAVLLLRQMFEGS